MDRHLLTALKKLKAIEPGQDYRERSRFLILSSQNAPKKSAIWDFLSDFQSNRLALATEILGIALLAVLVGTYAAYRTNKNNMVVQANELNSSIQVKINEIQYIIKTQAPKGSLNSELVDSLNQAAAKLNQAETDLNNNKIDSAVENIKVAEAIFRQMETKLGIPQMTPTSTPAAPTLEASSTRPLETS